MENFIDKPMAPRRFVFEGDFGILTVGYHNFRLNYNPDYNFRVQNFYTWHFVLSGKGRLQIEGNTYDVTAGQMFFIPPATEIRYFPKEEEPWEYIWFSLKGDISKHYGELLGFNAPVKDNENFNKSKYILKRMFDELEQGGGYFGVLSAFYELMELSTSTQPHTGIDGVKRLIDEGFTRNDFSIEQLCEDTGISHPHLLRLFKEKYNTTLVKYLNKKRIEYACQLLLTTELSVKSVAFSCGFSDELHFMKTFKNKMGVSALKYRNSQKNK